MNGASNYSSDIERLGFDFEVYDFIKFAPKLRCMELNDKIQPRKLWISLKIFFKKGTMVEIGTISSEYVLLDRRDERRDYSLRLMAHFI